jgi:outer membrane protein TolC
LDKTAVALNRKIKETQEESFLAKSKTDEGLLEQLEVLKRVIAYKQEQEEVKARELERKAKEKTLLELLDKRQQEKLDSLSEEELLEQLREVQAR